MEMKPVDNSSRFLYPYWIDGIIKFLFSIPFILALSGIFTLPITYSISLHFKKFLAEIGGPVATSYGRTMWLSVSSVFSLSKWNIFSFYLPLIIAGLWLIKFLKPSLDFSGISLREEGLQILGGNVQLGWNKLREITRGRFNLWSIIFLQDGKEIPLGFIVLFRSLSGYEDVISEIQRKIEEKGKIPSPYSSIGGIYEYPLHKWLGNLFSQTFLALIFTGTLGTIINLLVFIKLTYAFSQAFKEDPIHFPLSVLYAFLIFVVAVFLIFLIREILPFLCPLRVEVNEDGFKIDNFLMKKVIPWSEVEFIQRDIKVFRLGKEVRLTIVNFSTFRYNIFRRLVLPPKRKELSDGAFSP